MIIALMRAVLGFFCRVEATTETYMWGVVGGVLCVKEAGIGGTTGGGHEEEEEEVDDTLNSNNPTLKGGEQTNTTPNDKNDGMATSTYSPNYIAPHDPHQNLGKFWWIWVDFRGFS